MLPGLNGDHPSLAVDSLFVLCITESTRYTFIENFLSRAGSLATGTGVGTVKKTRGLSVFEKY